MYCDPWVVTTMYTKPSNSLCFICAHWGSWCLPVVNGATIVLPFAHRLVALCRYFVAVHFETIFVLHHFQGRREYSSSLSHKDASQNGQLSSTGCHQFCQIVSFMTLQLKSHTLREWKVNGLEFGNGRALARVRISSDNTSISSCQVESCVPWLWWWWLHRYVAKISHKHSHSFAWVCMNAHNWGQ